MAKNEGVPVESSLEPVKKLNPFVLAIDKSLEPIDMNVVNQEMGLSGPRIPAENLVDSSFLILGAKAYQSSFDESKHVYFCVCKDERKSDVFTTSLGGSAIVDLLDSLSAAGVNRPLRVTLRQKESAGGRTYYYFE